MTDSHRLTAQPLKVQVPVFSYYQYEENFSTRVTSEIFMTLMNNIYVSTQEISLSKWFSTRFTFEIFATFMNSLMCLLIWFSISNFYSLIFSDNIFCFKICLWQFFLQNRDKIMTNYHVRFPIDLNSMLIWNFFSDFFPLYL